MGWTKERDDCCRRALLGADAKESRPRGPWTYPPTDHMSSLSSKWTVQQRRFPSVWMVNPETNTQAWRGSWQASQSDQRFAKASCFSRVQAGCTTRFAASQTAPSIKGRVDCGIKNSSLSSGCSAVRVSLMQNNSIRS